MLNTPTIGQIQTLKKLAAMVYLCQALTFMLAGLPLLLSVAIAENHGNGALAK